MDQETGRSSVADAVSHAAVKGKDGSMVEITIESLEQALKETGSIMERQRLLKQLWKLRQGPTELARHASDACGCRIPKND